MDIKAEIDVRDIVYGAITRETGVAQDKLTPETTLEQLGLSSIDTVMMFFDIETELDIELDQETLQEIETLGQLADYLQAAVAPQ